MSKRCEHGIRMSDVCPKCIVTGRTGRIADLEAENARLQTHINNLENIRTERGLEVATQIERLQARVEEFKRQSEAIGCCAGRVEGYKALAERRGAAIEELDYAINKVSDFGDDTRVGQALIRARAAIDMTPEEAREKEGQR